MRKSIYMSEILLPNNRRMANFLSKLPLDDKQIYCEGLFFNLEIVKPLIYIPSRFGLFKTLYKRIAHYL